MTSNNQSYLGQIERTFNLFMTEVFEAAVISSTRASWDGRWYCVELFPDKSYRVLWSGLIGNQYDSQGVILNIPSLDDDDWNDDEDSNQHFFHNAEEEMRLRFEQWKEDYLL